ncbi:CoA pyrophosphatase [Anaerovorax odorimutans]|uniref:CoA pyrophosphatase n=1 Tax=Anaerovorax odorimutans TaxID=109327 RepID=A0ABT1RPG1_9FIRM|nr:CoA pyrophosphatase [Anaerovorax odorimutans]MCQ4637086.1 CoA pyrophosphatase [Anaerovorax odorimutans]
MKTITLDKIEKLFEKRTPRVIGRHNYFSVLVPLVQKDGELYLLYEVRAEHMKRQPGEVCFPGGQVEDGESFEACAVRETMEELGIGREDIQVISQLDTLYTYSNFTMFSFLGTIKEESLWQPELNPDEVKEIFLVPLSYLWEHEPAVYKMKVAPMVGEDFPYEKIKFSKGYNWRKGTTEVPIYEFENRVIWGLTGRITRNFIETLKSQEAEDV